MVPVLIREEKYLEVENYNAEEEEDQLKWGRHLMEFGRRLVDLAEEFVPQETKQSFRKEIIEYVGFTYRRVGQS